MSEDENIDKLNDRLKAEGQLIRNTGTNSIKSVRSDLSKFTPIFKSIDENITIQTQILRSTLALSTSTAAAAERQRQLDEARRTVIPPTPDSGSSDPTPSRRSRSPANDDEAAKGLLGLLGLGGLAGISLATVISLVKKPLMYALFAAVAPAAGKILGEITEDAFLSLGSDPGTATRFAEAAGLAGLWGVIGLAFGRRAGLVGAAAGAAYSFGDEVLDSLGMDKDKLVTIAGQTMELETLAGGILGSLGGALGLALTSPGIWKGVSDTVVSSAKWLGWRRGFALAASAAVISLYGTYGDDMKNWLETQGLSKGAAGGVVDIGAYTAMGVSMGYMFGPHGALVGAGIGFAIGLGKTVADWINGVRDKSIEKFNANMEQSKEILARMAAGEEISAEDQAVLRNAEIEANRMSQLNVPQETKDQAVSFADAMKEQRISTDLDYDKGVVNGQVEDRVLRAIQGDSVAMNELLELAKDSEEQRFGITKWLKPSNEYIEDMMRSFADGLVVLENSAENIEKWDQMVDSIASRNFKGVNGRSAPVQFDIINGREQTQNALRNMMGNDLLGDNYNSNLSKISTASKSVLELNSSTPVIISAPNNSVTQISQKGGTTSSVINSFGGNSRQDLDAQSRPGGVQ